ncbi:unnamed protein product [Rotaria sp. Silwood1]|nr:unnamed protein product [Rotaria sp. Silwood1]
MDNHLAAILYVQIVCYIILMTPQMGNVILNAIIAMSGKFYHGDPDRDHNFWVYPRNKALVTPRWDTYNADDLCDNYTFIGQDG